MFLLVGACLAPVIIIFLTTKLRCPESVVSASAMLIGLCFAKKKRNEKKEITVLVLLFLTSIEYLDMAPPYVFNPLKVHHA